MTGSAEVRQGESESRLGFAQTDRHDPGRADRAARLWARVRGLVGGASEREEASLDALLAARSGLSQPNVIAVVSPKGGVGKTTCTFLLGNLLASATELRCVAIDPNPDFGTLGALTPSESRVQGTLADIFAEMDEIDSVAELMPFVSRLPTGLHLIAAHPRAEVMSAITPELYAMLVDFLGRFYDVILMDLGTGVEGPEARFALERADQSVVVSTPDFVALSTVLRGLRYLRDQPVTLVLNQAPRRPRAESRREVEQELRRQGIDRHVILPYDERLRTMLDSASYELGALDRDTRMPIKELGLAAYERLD